MNANYGLNHSKLCRFQYRQAEEFLNQLQTSNRAGSLMIFDTPVLALNRKPYSKNEYSRPVYPVHTPRQYWKLLKLPLDAFEIAIQTFPHSEMPAYVGKSITPVRQPIQKLVIWSDLS